jgi:hypothetical protein
MLVAIGEWLWRRWRRRWGRELRRCSILDACSSEQVYCDRRAV